MRRFSIATDLCTASRLSLGLFILIFVLPVIFRPARAQEKADPVSSSCVPSDLDALVFSERHTVRVSEFKEGFASKDGAKSETASSDALRASKDARQQKEMYSVLLKQARQGNAAAMVNVGLFYLAGWGTQTNAGAGLYWLHEAGDRGNNAAFYALGILYLEGCGVRQDAAQAFHFFRLGATAGNPAAQANLGYLYDHGLGTTQDHGTAAYWYRINTFTEKVCQWTRRQLSDGSKKLPFKDTLRRRSWWGLCSMPAVAPLRTCGPLTSGFSPLCWRETREVLLRCGLWRAN